MHVYAFERAHVTVDPRLTAAFCLSLLALAVIDLKDSKPATFNDIRMFLTNCVSEAGVGAISQTDYDCRYFWQENGVGRCLNGFVRESMSMQLQEMRQYDEWLTPQFVFSAIAGSRNPSVRGFLVEQACIQAMLKSPQEYVDGLRFRPSDIRFFDRGSESSVFVQNSFCVLYAPRPFNYKAVDAVLRILPAFAQASDFEGAPEAGKLEALQKFAAVVVPVQITLRSIEKHQASIAAFFSSRDVWVTRAVRADGQPCSPSDFAWVFHWIVPKAEANKVGEREVVASVERSTRSGTKMTAPAFTSFVVSIEALTGKADILRSPPPSPSKV